MSISLALSISLLFISLLQLINGAQFLNITPLFLLSACLAVASAPAPVIVFLTLASIYVSPQSHKLDYNIVVLNVMSLLVVYTPTD